MYSQKVLRFIKRKVIPQKTHFWEYYGRLKFATEVINKTGIKNFKVLDIGGATGDNLLKKFGVQNVTTLDLKPGADIVASAAEIPLDDGTYNFVTSLDMMEHVPQDLRSKVISEMIRVAKNMVIIVAPVNSKENIWAEDFVLKYRHADFLIEHKDQGLVDFDLICSQLDKYKQDRKIASYERTELDNLQTWVSLMTEDFGDSSEIYQKCYEQLENKFVPRRIALVIHKS